ncbi:universal stress protein [Motiliproteus sp. MSK22-1]|uniref:universal stress protein n=1 Tax=Motiliproteus sp. MSK22-1 TaxID=1897630 RepID=UPI000975C8D9|nr:universal stress protein [Motiliproteus sp. MSK22-1]OMH39787.1 hypothetical protein BGP75_01670 [Motiliproteus sp. MSK22-1]
MKKILVIAERAQEAQVALVKALSLAKLNSASIHVAVICYEELGWLDEAENSEASVNAKVDILNGEEVWWREYLKAQCGSLSVTYELVWQKYAADWTLKHCSEHTYDLVVKKGHRSEAAFYTPTDWLLLRDSKIPVYLVSDQHYSDGKAVLVALDLMAKSDEKQDLNQRLIESAFRLAVETNSDLHCCYIIKIPEMLKSLNLVDVTDHNRKVEESVRQKFKSLFDCYDLDNTHIHIRSGSPWKMIASLANELQVNCIVIGTMGRKGLAGKFFGNTSERVIHVAQKDLLVIGEG